MSLHDGLIRDDRQPCNKQKYTNRLPTTDTCHRPDKTLTDYTTRTYKLLEGRQQTRVVEFLAVFTSKKQLHFEDVTMDDVSDA